MREFYFELPVKERFECVKSYDNCINCLIHETRAELLFQEEHHTLLHLPTENKQTLGSNIAKPSTNLFSNINTEILLSTAFVSVLAKDKTTHFCQILLDCGSQLYDK